jgi:hypothetical protein
VLNVATQSSDGTTSSLIEDGVVSAVGFDRVVMTMTSSNADLDLPVIPSNCNNDTQITLSEGKGCKNCAKF